MFSQIQVKIGNNEVENNNSNYPYRAIIENLLCYDNEAKTTFLQNEMYTKDDKDNMDDLLIANAGLVSRRKIYDREGGAFHTKGKFKSDVFNMNKYMLPQVNSTVVLTRSQDGFVLVGENVHVSSGGYTIKIEEAALQVRRVKISKEIALSHAMQLEQTAAKYPVKRVIMRAQNVPAGVQNFALNSIHRGIMPSRVIVGFVNSKGYAGNWTNNPFKFENMDIRYIKLKVASTPLPYSDGITCQEKNNQHDYHLD